MTVKKLFFAEFRSVPFRTSEWANPRHIEFRERSTLFRGITKIPLRVYSAGFFWKEFLWQPCCRDKKNALPSKLWKRKWVQNARQTLKIILIWGCFFVILIKGSKINLKGDMVTRWMPYHLQNQLLVWLFLTGFLQQDVIFEFHLSEDICNTCETHFSLSL